MNAIDSRATEIRVYVQIPSNNSMPDNETPQIVVADNGISFYIILFNGLKYLLFAVVKDMESARSS